MRVYKTQTGGLWKKIHAYYGETKYLSTPIVNGEVIWFSVCGWNNGDNKGCTSRKPIKE